MAKRARYQFTYKRKAALHKAQLVSARKRKGMSTKKKLAIAGGVGVIALGVGATLYGRAVVRGGPENVTKTMPPKAKPSNAVKGIVPKVPSVNDVVEFKRTHSVNAFEKYQTYDYGQITGVKVGPDGSPFQVSIQVLTGDRKHLKRVPTRLITQHRKARSNISPNPAHLSDAEWQSMGLTMFRVLKEDK